MKTFATAAAFALLGSAAFAGETPSNPDAKVYFINITDGATVQSPVFLQFGLSGMGVAPAGTEKEMTGHHHLLVDRAPFGEGADDAEMDADGLYSDDNHRHFGKGQTETSVELAPGTHTLQLVLGDLYHAPHDTAIKSDVITITVTE
ncbi:DUF4399 domain-containing protein [Pseudaestuariivita atlantica]|uniref:Rod shape-determining protein RodA n=1 Tax=Pseudaestuariivita atlantica TaxID=1317121 RepID=A0A0L1JTE7_9RHOB|nr:DUF4399 domain-containing protein [Pseudaestuariivita atlantica]KNG94693.1 rod shape-determining protein RodA [Pseudaestuariivita atlantica]